MRNAREVASRIDAIGIVGFAVAMTGLLAFLLSLPHPDWIALAVAVVFAVALVLWELRVATPFFDVRLLASNGALTRTYTWPSATGAIPARQEEEHRPHATGDNAHDAEKYHNEHERSQPTRIHAQASSTVNRYLHTVSVPTGSFVIAKR